MNEIDKINKISKIVWINLEESRDRRKYMENLLKDVPVQNTRINAINGRYNNDIKAFIKDIPKGNTLQNGQIACTLSHIKAISSLKDCEGDYFMICEDDISFDNIKYFPEYHDLKYIIENAPSDFEVLMLYKTSYDELKELYGDWNEYRSRGTTFYGTVCYIISKSAVQKFINISEYLHDDLFIFSNKAIFDVSDIFIYKNLKTYTYKYNFITSIDHNSILDSNLTFYRQSVEYQLNVIKTDFKKKTLIVKIDASIVDYFLNNKYYSMQNIEQFCEYFLPDRYEYIIKFNTEIDSSCDIALWRSDLEDNSSLNPNEVNILICIENCPFWAHHKWQHYKHYNKYGDYGNKKIDIYYYNHIDTLYKTDSFLSIPLIYRFIDYYNKNYKIIHPTEYTDFANKRFCLIINKSNLNPEIQSYINILNQIGNGEIDNISIYNEYIESKSCYHSCELLNVMNKYKFVLCFENSYADGYITEKIFNCFFARTIPIYKGSSVITRYISSDAFLNPNDIQVIHEIQNNEYMYNNIINSKKISSHYIDYDYKNKLCEFIDNKINRKK